MKSIKEIGFKDQLVACGLCFIILSLVFFLLPEQLNSSNQNDMHLGVFAANYVLAVIYAVILMLKTGYKWRIWKGDIEPSLLLLILFMISAFQLNKSFQIFEESTQWVCIYLTSLSAAFILLIYRERFPAFFQKILYFTLGSGLVIYLYYAIYLLPFYAIGVIAFFLFGMSLLIFTPLFFFTFSILLFRKIYKTDKKSIYPFLAGIVVPVLVAAGFIISWKQTKTKAENIINKGIVDESTLPLWARLGQEFPKNAFTEKMLKTGLVYTTVRAGGFWQFGLPQKSFDAVKKHDPLVVSAVAFNGELNVSREDRIKMLEFMYDARHPAQERLWSGDKLETTNVISNIQIFPEYRMAYTEKTVSVYNASENDWGNEQEAIYTFHLPEGGVVTSLSLWINGNEEKARLTTKSKASNAYKTIVGTERRDPSVVQWQEGNTVSIRVFPCPPRESRRFKIGVTAPLQKKEDLLTYQNIYFEGPDGTGATETVKLKFTQQPLDLRIPFSTEEDATNEFTAEKGYDAYWEATFKNVALSTSSFSFDGCNYKMENYKREYEPFEAADIYLDINESWSKQDIDEIWKLLGNKNVFVYNNELIRLTAENKTKVIDKLKKLRYSLFPFNKIKYPEKSLLITKSSLQSPNLRDLEGSNFSKKLVRYLGSGTKVRVFNLDNSLSPYLKTLLELRMFIYDEGDMKTLASTLKNNIFNKPIENDSTIIITSARLLIKECSAPTNIKAPDHLLRLFAYNHVMKNISEHYFDNDDTTPAQTNESLIAEAEKANIVSPVSSLIVLETQKDYERFGIDENKNSLQNASMKSSGAVPEPHEWLLICLLLSIIVYVYLLPRFKQSRIIKC